MTLKLASYNIQYGVGQDGRYRLERIAEALAGQDIICLQEVTTGWRHCNGDDQAQLLAEQLDLYAAYAPAFELDASADDSSGRAAATRRGFGNMVLSRWPILYSRPHSLPRPAIEVPPEFHPNVDFPRVALEAVIDCDGVALRVFSLHLSHLPGAQRGGQIAQLKALVAGLPTESLVWPEDPRLAAWSEERAAPPSPRGTLLLGDFNFTPDDADYQAMLAPYDEDGQCLQDGWAAARERQSEDYTCLETDGSLMRLDYLFATEDLAESIATVRVDHDNKSSDHFPLYFTFDL